MVEQEISLLKAGLGTAKLCSSSPFLQHSSHRFPPVCSVLGGELSCLPGATLVTGLLLQSQLPHLLSLCLTEKHQKRRLFYFGACGVRRSDPGRLLHHSGLAKRDSKL